MFIFGMVIGIVIFIGGVVAGVFGKWAWDKITKPETIQAISTGSNPVPISAETVSNFKAKLNAAKEALRIEKEGE
jgi:hypothetical protein